MAAKRCATKHLILLRLVYGLLFLAAIAPLPVNALAVNMQTGIPMQSSINGSTVGYAMPGSPVTVANRFHLAEAWGTEADAEDGMILLGLESRSTGSGQTLRLVWAPDHSGWLPRWQLRLQIVGTNNAMADELVTDVTLGDMSQTPMPGHRYDAALSYNPVTGRAIVLLTDVTTDERLYAGVVEIGKTSGALQSKCEVMRFGSSIRASHVVVEEARFFQQELPVATTWEIGSLEKGSEAFLPSWRFQLSDMMAVRINSPMAEKNGAYHIILNHGEKQVELARVESDTTGIVDVKLPLSQIHIGQSTLSFQYELDNKVLLTESRQIVLGSITARFAPVSVDLQKGKASVNVHVSPSEGMPPERITVRAEIQQLVWDTKTRQYSALPFSQLTAYEGMVAVPKGEQGITIGADVSLPAQPGYWQVNYKVDSASGVSIAMYGNESRFATYAPGQTITSEPFTMVVLPDTQLYSWSRPHIFERQTQWIAENAAGKNIGLVMHMGDVTEQNSVREWDIASKSIGLLDGVVPYVITPGNHDIMLQGGDYSKHSRTATLLNQYFPAERFTKLAGVYEQGRAENSYHITQIAGTDYLILSLEYLPRDSVLAWANDVVAAHPKHRVIVITHAFTSSSGYRSSGYDDTLPSDPQDQNNSPAEVWNKFARNHANIFLILSGHIPATTVPRDVTVGRNGNFVYQLLCDFQGEPNGGNGWLVLLEFSPDEKVTVRTYSPYLEMYKTEKLRNHSSNYYVIDLAKGRFYEGGEESQ